jgi:hypothetical protein
MKKWFLTAVVANSLDCVITIWMVTKFGLQFEGNPLMRAVMAHGIGWFILLKMVITNGLFVWLYGETKNVDFNQGYIKGLHFFHIPAVMFTLVVIWNIMMILMHMRYL